MTRSNITLGKRMGLRASFRLSLRLVRFQTTFRPLNSRTFTMGVDRLCND